VPFQKNNKLGRGRPKKSPETIWVLESLKKEGVDYTKVLADAIRTQNVNMINALARLAPHIANKPKIVAELEGVDSLVIKRLEDKPKE
jgi:hypothetical protein